jgi:hypothetical protein
VFGIRGKESEQGVKSAPRIREKLKVGAGVNADVFLFLFIFICF